MEIPPPEKALQQCPGCPFSSLNPFVVKNHQIKCPHVGQALHRKLASAGKKARLHLLAHSQPNVGFTLPEVETTVANEAPPLDIFPSPTPITSSGRPIRQHRRLPACYRQDPDPNPGLPPWTAKLTDGDCLPASPVLDEGLSGDDLPPIRPPLSVWRTQPNAFGVVKEYYGTLPNDEPVPIYDVANDAPTSAAAFQPYPNISTALLAKWYWSTGVKSEKDFDHLCSIWAHPCFNLKEAIQEKWAVTNRHLFDNNTTPSKDGWQETKVSITIPFGKAAEPSVYDVPGLQHRPIVEVIKSVCSSKASETFHYVPHGLFWQTAGASEAKKVQHEVYNSPELIKEHIRLQGSLPEPGCDLPHAVVALMVSSDSTHLAQFGDASLWPCYLMFGNQSKYERARPGNHALHHLAYFPKYLKLPGAIHKHIHDKTGKGPTDPLISYCRRELAHRVWDALLDAEFMHAYHHGIVVQCYDGIRRRLYPRFITYSADYPEKVLIATIRDMGSCPCPMCLVKKENIPLLGTIADTTQRRNNSRVDNEARQTLIRTAHTKIFGHERYVVNSVTGIEPLLKPESYVPTENAFSKLKSEFFDLYAMLVVDPLHEGDSGNFKKLITHLVRILHSLGAGTVATFDARFCQVPAFGNETIRRFHGNVSKLSRLGARDFEDISQCVLPVIEGLVRPEHDSMLQSLLFTWSAVQGLSRFRMHTDTTVALLELEIQWFGILMRRFAYRMCPEYATRELPKEANSRTRQAARNIPIAQTSSAPLALANSGRSVEDHSHLPRKRRRLFGNSDLNTADSTQKSFSLKTYKFHALGHYPEHICRIGTTDNYSTQLSEREHRRVKDLYARTNKRAFVGQISNLERHTSGIDTMEKQLGDAGTLNATELSELSDLSLDECGSYSIAASARNYVDIHQFELDRPADLAAKNFMLHLKNHILARLRDLPDEGTDTSFTDHDRAGILFKHNRMYSHRLLRVHYTTYDLQRSVDLVRLQNGRSDVMLLANDEPPEGYDATSEPHRYWYARVLGIYHVNAWDLSACSNQIKRIDFLHVRWFGTEMERSYGWRTRQLERVGFVSPANGDAFGFVDPALVLRGAHMLPAFHYGRSNSGLAWSDIARPSGESDDWELHYVNRFVDRDMIARYLTGVVGHLHTSQQGLQVNIDEASESLLGSIRAEIDLAAADDPGIPVVESLENNYTNTSRNSDDEHQFSDSEISDGDADEWQAL